MGQLCNASVATLACVLLAIPAVAMENVCELKDSTYASGDYAIKFHPPLEVEGVSASDSFFQLSGPDITMEGSINWTSGFAGEYYTIDDLDAEGMVYHLRGHADGVSFMTYFLERHKDENPISVGVNLRVANDKGNVSLTMRRVAAKPEGTECTTSAIRLTPEAARDLIAALSKVI